MCVIFLGNMDSPCGVRSPLRDVMNSGSRRDALRSPKLSLSPPGPAFSLGALLENKDNSSFGLGDKPSTFASTSASSVVSKPLSSSVAIGENLMQGKIDYLEKQREELGEQIQEKDEENRKSRLQIERLEMKFQQGEDEKGEMAVQVDVLKKEKESLLNQISSLSMARGENNMPPPPPDASLASQLADALSKPPSYMSSDDPATEGIWTKMQDASKELRRMEVECKTIREEKAAAIKECDAKIETQQKENEVIQARMEEDRKTMVILKNAAEESDKLRAKCEEAEKDNGEFSGLLKETMDNLLHMEAKLQQAQAQNEATIEEKTQSEERIVYLEGEIRDMIEREARAVEEAKEMALQRARELENRSEDDVIAKFIENGGDSSLLQLIEDLRGKLSESEAKRKKLHGELQDLRGNVRVLVRARPFLRGDGDNHESCLTANKDNTSISVDTKNGKTANLFHFDHVFGQNTSQERVYHEVSDLIQSALDGYRVCIFSYGQTGSGKTWTMSGERLGSNRGIIPRAVEQIIGQTMSMKEAGWDMTVSVSVLELYNEELKDLLPADGIVGNNNTKGEKLKITNQQGRVNVVGLNSVSIDTSSTHHGMRQLEGLLERAGKARTTVATGMNERSSRSHMVFLMEMIGVHADGTTVTRGGLRLVDLAGSERLDRTGTANDAARLKETVNINKSLSCLADVFVNLGAKSQHIPYRNSKITMLLQDCLSGDGKSLMIVNVSPTAASSGETVCSLRFADQVSQVELGKAQKQMYTTVPAKDDAKASGNTSAGAGRSRSSSNPNRAAAVAAAEADNGDEMDTSTSSNASASRGVKRVSSMSGMPATGENTSKDAAQKRTRIGGGAGKPSAGRWH